MGGVYSGNVFFELAGSILQRLGVVCTVGQVYETAECCVRLRKKLILLVGKCLLRQRGVWAVVEPLGTRGTC